MLQDGLVFAMLAITVSTLQTTLFKCSQSLSHYFLSRIVLLTQHTETRFSYNEIHLAKEFAFDAICSDLRNLAML